MGMPLTTALWSGDALNSTYRGSTTVWAESAAIDITTIAAIST
jgi:hypothetical protein